MKKEIEVFVDKLSKISLSDFILTFSVHPIEKSIEECVSELKRRIETFVTNQAKEFDVAFHQIKFYQYDIVKTAENRMTLDIIIDDGPWINPQTLEKVFRAKVQSKLLCTPWMLIIPNMAANQIKKTCEEVFYAEIKSEKDIIISSFTEKITRRIDRILEYIKNETI